MNGKKYVPEIVEAIKTRNASQIHKMNEASDLKGVFRAIEGCIELSVLTLAYYYLWTFSYRGNDFYNFYGNGKYLLTLVYILLMAVILYMSDGFQYGHRKLTEVVISQGISVILVNIFTYLQLCLIGNRMLNALPMLLLTVLDFAIALLFSSLFTVIYHRMYVPKDMLMIYGSETALDLKFKMDERRDKYAISKLLPYDAGYDVTFDEISNHDAVIINDVPSEERNDILKYCYQHEIRTYVVPKISDIIQNGAENITLFDTPLYLVKGRGLNLAQRFIKRTMDIVLCLIVLIPCLLIMAVVAAAIKLEDHGPVFFRQERVTQNGRVFTILKFRSMIVDAEKDGKSIPATDNDPRITKVGKVIRATRIDELPQILNILKGDMSWVGPRPERVEHAVEYMKEVPEFVLRTKVKGGLTGYAQIYGKYNTTPYDKLRLDLMYIENYSVLLDLKLIVMTIQTMFKKESTEGFDREEELQEKRRELVHDQDIK